MNISRKILLSVAATGSAAAVAGLGTFASFTSTTQADQSVASGTVVVGLGTAGSTANRLTVGASGLVPGDTLQRAITLTNSGSQDLGSIVLTTTATTSSVLDTDATNGLQMVIEKCPAPGWVESVTQPYTYTCATTPTAVLASRAVIGSNLSLSGLASTTAGGTDSLRVTLTLPPAADNTFQGRSSVVRYAFTAAQRAAASK